MNIVNKFLEDSGLLLKGVCETIQNKVKNKRRIYQYVIRYSRCNSLGKKLAGKGIIRAGYECKRSLIKDF